MKLITWNVQWCRGVDQKVDPARVVADAKRIADFDVLCLQEIADNYPDPLLGGSNGRGPVRGARLAPARLHGDRRRRGRPDRRRRLAAPLRQHDPVAVAGAAGVTGTCCRIPPITTCRACRASRSRPWSHAGVRRRAGDHHASRVLLAAQARGAGRGAARDLRRGACAMPTSPRIGCDDEGPYHAQPRPAATVITGDFNLEPDDPLHARMVAAVRRRHAAAVRRLGSRIPGSRTIPRSRFTKRASPATPSSIATSSSSPRACEPRCEAVGGHGDAGVGSPAGPAGAATDRQAQSEQATIAGWPPPARPRIHPVS